MRVPHLTTAASALPLAVLLMLGPAGAAQALECEPGLAPAVVNGAEMCVPTQYSPGVQPSYNPGESYYNPETGEYREAVPAVPVPADSPTAAPTTVPATPEPAPSSAPATGSGTGVVPAPAATPSPSATATKSTTPSPSLQAEESDTERTSLVLPAVAAVVILGLLAGTLLLRHRNRRS